MLSAWREAPFYSDRERAALGWCEALTLLPSSGAPDAVFEEVTRQFDDEEIVALTLAIVAINGWNRFAVGLRSPVGHYVSPHGGERVAAAGAQASADEECQRRGSTMDVGAHESRRGTFTHV